MVRPRDRNPQGLARDIYVSESWRINGGRRLTAYVEAVPTDETDGFDVSKWSEISVKFYGDNATYAGVALNVRVWRWYSTAWEGNNSTAPIGRWIADRSIVVPVDPTLITAANKQDWTFPTLHCDKMYFQVVSYADGANLGWLYIQPYGHLKRDADQVMSSSSSTMPAIAQATHNAAVIATGIHPMDEAKDFDGAVLPNAVAEGDAVRAASTLYGIRYVMPVTETGAATPVIPHDSQIASGLGVAAMMAGVEAKNFDGAALPNAVAEGDAARMAATLSGVPYSFLADQNGAATPVIAHDAVIDSASNGRARVGLMGVAEAKDFDGSALPNAVAEGDAARIAATLNGVLYNMLVTEDGSDTPVLLHSDPITTAAGEDGVMMAGAEARSVQATAVTEADATRLMANLYGEQVLANYIWATQANRTEEDDPLDTRDTGDELNLSNLTAAQHDYYYSMEHFKFITIQLDFAAALGVGVTVWGSAQDDGTAPATCIYVDVTNAWFGAASFNADNILEKDTPTQLRWIRIRFDNTGGAGTEDVDAYIRRCW